MSKQTRIGISLLVLGLLHGATIGAGFLAPYPPQVQDRDFPFAPPTRLHFLDATGRFHVRPFVHGLEARADSPGAYAEKESEIYPIRFFVPREEVGGVDGGAGTHLLGVERPGRLFLLGTDGFGRDQFSRLLFGGRISLLFGLMAAAVSLGFGLLLGGVAGFYGGWLDDVLMRGAELLLALPWLYCLLILRAFAPLSTSTGEMLVLLVAVVGLRGWARPARLVRGVVLSAKEREYVRAARGFGASATHLLSRHILPETLGLCLTQAALLIPQYIMGEVTLSFLGLGVGEPAPSWGNMLAAVQHYYVLANYWWMCVPGVILVPVFAAYYGLADALQEHWHVEGPVRLMRSSRTGAMG